MHGSVLGPGKLYHLQYFSFHKKQGKHLWVLWSEVWWEEGSGTEKRKCLTGHS